VTSYLIITTKKSTLFIKYNEMKSHVTVTYELGNLLPCSVIFH